MNRVKPSLSELAIAYFKMGLTAYGAVMLQELRSSFLKRGWITEKDFEEGLAMVQLYPGPVMFNLAAYIAYRLKGVVGAFLCATLFLLPSIFLILLLSYVYFNYKQITWINSLFPPLEGMVLGVLVYVFSDFIRKFSNTLKKALISIVSFVLILLKINGVFVVVVSFLLGVVLFTSIKGEKDVTTSKISIDWFKTALLGSPFLISLLIGLTMKEKWAELLYSMTKVGSVAFGNGFTILPLLQQEVVNYHPWLSLKEFTDGIALGQITPGPILITATFIGYKVAGIIGSLIASFGMFYPSFFFTIVVADIYEELKEVGLIKRGISAVLSSFSGMLGVVVLSISKFLISLPYSLLWALYAFLAIKYSKLGVLPIFLIGLTVEFFLYIFGIRLF
jgi:chromate transporter